MPAEPKCAPDAGRVVPVIDRDRCGAKQDCVRVCPRPGPSSRERSPGPAASMRQSKGEMQAWLRIRGRHRR